MSHPSKKRHSINIPGSILDSVRDNTSYEDDERFAKRQKLKGPSVVHRKENRKQKRMDKKQQKTESKQHFKQKQEEFHRAVKQNKSKPKPTESKKPKIVKRVSFSETNDVHEIPARNKLESTEKSDIELDFEKWEKDFVDESEDSEHALSQSDFDSQDEQEEEDANSLIQTLKQLKQVQRGEFKTDDNIDDASEDEEPLSDDEKSIMDQLMKLKGNKKSNSEIRIVKEDDLSDDDSLHSGEDSDAEENIEMAFAEENDSEDEVMKKLAALKKDKKSKSEIRIVKEDDLEDDSLSDDDNEEDEKNYIDDDEDEVMKKLAALKKNKNKTSSSEIRIVKEDDLDDDSFSEEEEEDEEEVGNQSEEENSEEDDESDVMKKLAALKGNKKSNSTIKVVKEEDLVDDSFSEEDLIESEEENADNTSEDTGETESDIMKKLAALKGNKKSTTKLKIVKEDDLSDDEISEEEASGSDSDSDSEMIDNEESEEYVSAPSYSRDEDDMDYYSKKLGLDKNKKISQEGEDDLVGGLFDGLDFMQEYDNTNKTSTKKAEKESKKEKKSKKETDEEVVDFFDPALMKDEDEMKYYAEKLGMNADGNLTKEDDDDIIGGLFDGIDLGFSNKSKPVQELESESEDENNNGRSGDEDEINSDDFDDDEDLDDDDRALLKEMYGIEDSESGSDFDSEEESESEDGPRVKENPYLAPGVDVEEKTEGSKYIPPALRKKLAAGGTNDEDSEQMKIIFRLIKGPFNKLSEPTLSNVISELNSVYNDNPRQFVNEAILKIIMESISISTPMLESFLILYAAAIVALYKLQGVEFGAFIIQKLVEKFNSEIESSERTNQQILNVVGFLGYLYTLNLVSSALIYDIIKEKLILNPTELKADVLLKLIKSCGSKLRTDDSNALNSIIGLLSKSVKDNEARGIKTSTRSRFLIDTITDLKNNRLKNMENENTISMINRLKKQLGSINSGRHLDAIKVSLSDIENIEEKGKWWLVGSAWKGDEPKSTNNTESNVLDNDNELNDTDAVNWMELARQCRMNTDIRRAIFISIMSAEDFMDSFMKLEKLNLKKSQKLEIPNILMHCATMEINYNPYYSFLAKKLSNDHSMRRSFQLNLWDFVKELDGEDDTTTTILLDSTDDERLWKILNMGRFFGFLIGEGSLSLNLLRVINFLTVSSDVKLFLEIMIISMLDTIAKKSEVSAFGAGNSKKSKDIVYNGKLMAERIAKCNEQPLLMKGLQYFINNKLRDSDLIKGKKQKARIAWAIDAMSDMLTEMLKSSS